jgi:DNA-binding transcriptional regulator YbjK
MILREEIRAAALELADEGGLHCVTAKGIADLVGIHADRLEEFSGYTLEELIDTIAPEYRDELDNMKGKRVSPALRKWQIVVKAIGLSKHGGYFQVNFEEVAKAAGISTGLVKRYYPTVDTLRDAIVQKAIAVGDLDVIVQAMASRSPLVSDIPKELKEQAAKRLLCLAKGA